MGALARTVASMLVHAGLGFVAGITAHLNEKERETLFSQEGDEVSGDLEGEPMSAIRTLYNMVVMAGELLGLEDFDIDRTEKLLALGEAALARRNASDVYSGLSPGRQSMPESRAAYQAALDAYDAALAAIREGT